MPTVPTAAVPARRHARVAGVLASVTYPPATGPAQLRARLQDASGDLDLRWFGRRDIPGITAGRRIVVEGTVAAGEHRPVIHNPAYELLPEDTS